MATLRETLAYEPTALAFGTSGLRGLVVAMTDLECSINTAGFLQFLAQSGQLQSGETVLVAGDLRDSTPRIMRAVMQAIRDGGYTVEYHGLVPTPTIAYYALTRDLPCIMVTGSHIPADRNGIKFYKKDGEVMKVDEPAIKAAVADVRAKFYGEHADESAFTASGALKQSSALPTEDKRGAEAYIRRYLDVFPNDCLAGKKIVYYQHSAVGRDMLPELFEKLGAEVVLVGMSDIFIPFDSENVTPDNRTYFKRLAHEYPDNFAIASTDGDSDRPFVIDETGEFHRGDVLGVVTATWCHADTTAYPVSTSDAVDKELDRLGVPFTHTKIGSPYVIEAMEQAEAAGKQRAVGWEVNGGFMLGTQLEVTNGTLKALPTRDAFFPILVALLAASQANIQVSELFARLPQRFTDSGLIDNFPTETSQKILSRYADDTFENRQDLARYFSPEHGFGTITNINTLDGIRLTFDNGDIAHLRPSGNAPQLRIYSIAGSAERAAEITALAITEPDGIFRRMQAEG